LNDAKLSATVARMNDGLFNLSETCEGSGLTSRDIDYMVKCSICVPAKESTGRGVFRRFSAENLLELTQAGELVKAGLSSRQIHRIVAGQRAVIAHLPPAERVVRRFEAYIETVIALAMVFGKGDGYDAWLTSLTDHLLTVSKDELDGVWSRTRTRRARERAQDRRQKRKRKAVKPSASRGSTNIQQRTGG
jgi:hypothetical protein